MRRPALVAVLLVVVAVPLFLVMRTGSPQTPRPFPSSLPAGASTPGARHESTVQRTGTATAPVTGSGADAAMTLPTTASTASAGWSYRRWQPTQAGWQTMDSATRPAVALKGDESGATWDAVHRWQGQVDVMHASVHQLSARGHADLACWVDGRLRLIAPKQGTTIEQTALLRLEPGRHQVEMTASSSDGPLTFTMTSLDPTVADLTPVPLADAAADSLGLHGWTMLARGCFLADASGPWLTNSALITDGSKDAGWACALAGDVVSWTEGELELGLDICGGARAWIDGDLVLADWVDGPGRALRSRPIVTSRGQQHHVQVVVASARSYGSWRISLAGTHIPAQPFPMWALRPSATQPDLPASAPPNPRRRGLLDPVALARLAPATTVPSLTPPEPRPIGGAIPLAHAHQLWYRSTPATAEEVLGAVHLAMLTWSEHADQPPNWRWLTALAMAADPGLGVEVARWWWCLADAREVSAAQQQVLLAHAWWGTRQPGTIPGAFDWQRPFIVAAPLPAQPASGSWMAAVDDLLAHGRGAAALASMAAGFGPNAPSALLQGSAERVRIGAATVPVPDAAMEPVLALWRAPTAATLASFDNDRRRAVVDAYGQLFPLCADATVDLLWHLLTIEGWYDTRCDAGVLMWSGIRTAQLPGDGRTIPLMAWLQEGCLDPDQPSGSREQYVVEAGKYAGPALVGRHLPPQQCQTLLPLFERSAGLGRIGLYEPGRHLRPWAARAWWEALAAAGAQDALIEVLGDDAVDHIADIRRDAAIRLAGLLAAQGDAGQSRRLLERIAREPVPSDLSVMALTTLFDDAAYRSDAAAIDRYREQTRTMLDEIQANDLAGLGPRLQALLARPRP